MNLNELSRIVAEQSDRVIKYIGENDDNLKFLIPVYKYDSAGRPKKTNVPEVVNHAIVDSNRAAEVFMSGKWFLTTDGKYICKTIDGKRVLLHTFLTGYKQTDHKNGNGFVNTSENLREATSSQNMRNRDSLGKTSDYNSVSENITRGYEYWQTQITPPNYIYLRVFHIKKTAPKNICHNEKIAAFALDYAVGLLGLSEWYRLNNTKHLLTEEEIAMVQKRVEQQLKKHKLI